MGLFCEPGNYLGQDVRPLLKWIGNKHRVAKEVIAYFPSEFKTYYEPFLGTGAVLGALAPRKAVASDILRPLIDIWLALHDDPELLLSWYSERRGQFEREGVVAYERIKAHFNQKPNGADLLFISRSCYGGVIRFRKDGYLSTPVGAHKPIPSASMAERIAEWNKRTSGTRFYSRDFEETIDAAGAGDLVYCDPPYADTQAIVYGAQDFSLPRLFKAIERAKKRGASVALSIDGHKKSGEKICQVPIPHGLFPREALINCGRSMLRRFQMGGQSLEAEVVADRLLLTW